MPGNTMKKDILLKLSFSTISIHVENVGNDLLICIKGGDVPHIGCAVLAVPRPSLRNDGTIGCTSSVLNVTGHKDEEICRMLAEKAAKKYNCTAVCTGGFHVDGITSEEIQEVIKAVDSTDI